jgi:ribosomal-protein-alanine N-acetyltransferase
MKHIHTDVFAETNRIFHRKITLEDAPAMFELDADPEVHTYLGKSPIQTIAQAIAQIQFIRQQYIDYGIGRWAIVDKRTGGFVGWGGLKFRTDEVNGCINFYEVGYRLLKRFWGQGFATESTKATLKYAAEEMKLNTVYAMANVENKASKHALLKSGFTITNQLIHEGIACDWFEIDLK